MTIPKIAAIIAIGIMLFWSHFSFIALAKSLIILHPSNKDKIYNKIILI